MANTTTAELRPLTTKELAAELNIGREAARRIMQTTLGVIALPTINGNGKNVTRRMPRKVFAALQEKLSAKKARKQ